MLLELLANYILNKCQYWSKETGNYLLILLLNYYVNPRYYLRVSGASYAI